MLKPPSNKYVIATPIEKPYEGRLVLLEVTDPEPHIEAEIKLVHDNEKDLEIGQKILFVRLSGNYFQFENSEYVVVPKDQIIGQVE